MRVVNAPPLDMPLGLGALARLRPPHSRGHRSSHPACSSGQEGTPLLDAVRERGDRSGDIPFHVPGHKRGGSTPAPLRELLGTSLKYDLTELEGLDYLASPTGVVAEAQALAARVWGADATWFLVNGTTVGIHAAVMATCGPGDVLLLARNAHLSAFNAMVLAGCGARYVQPRYDQRFGVAHDVTPASLEAALRSAAESGARVGAVLVVSPTYFGVLSDIEGLARVCHQHQVPLIVDEAHGAHLGLAPWLPHSALQQGADLVVQSTHKQLSAMTQAAMLHAQGGRVSHDRLSRALQILQSSSPSYLLMSSLDAARLQAADAAAFTECLAAAAFARQRLEQVPGMELLSSQHLHQRQQQGSAQEEKGPACELDPLRLTLSFTGLGLSGYDAAAALEGEHHIVAELATPSCVVLAMSVGSTLAHAQALVAAVEQLSAAVAATKAAGGSGSERAAAADGSGSTAGMLLEVPAPPPPAATPRHAFHAASARVPAAAAVGRISAELVCPYPPGVPVLFPGEVVTAEILDSLCAVQSSGGRIAGCADPSLSTIAVLQS